MSPTDVSNRYRPPRGAGDRRRSPRPVRARRQAVPRMRNATAQRARPATAQRARPATARRLRPATAHRVPGGGVDAARRDARVVAPPPQPTRVHPRRGRRCRRRGIRPSSRRVDARPRWSSDDAFGAPQAPPERSRRRPRTAWGPTSRSSRTSSTPPPGPCAANQARRRHGGCGDRRGGCRRWCPGIAATQPDAHHHTGAAPHDGGSWWRRRHHQLRRVRPTPTEPTAYSATYVAPSSTYTVAIDATAPCWVMATDPATGTRRVGGHRGGRRIPLLVRDRQLGVQLGAPSDASVTMDGQPVTLPAGYRSPFNLTFRAAS